MIVFVIAFDESYIRAAIDFCLPSLLTSGNLPSIAHEAPELYVLTVTRDAPLMAGLLQQRHDVVDFFGDRIHWQQVDADFESDAARMPGFRRALTSNLLCRAVNFCLKANKSFLFAVPDLIYADGSIAACWQLHRLTGKVISIFNGRVRPNAGEPRFAPALFDRLRQRHGVRDYFFSNMAGAWRNWTTNDPDVIPDAASPGHVIFRGEGHSFIFGRPNPLLGRFTPRDLMFFANGGDIRAWDHDWQDQLLREGRLLVQTNLDIGMSIELDEDVPAGPRPLLNKFGVGDLSAQKENKFTWPYAYMPFTTVGH